MMDKLHKLGRQILALAVIVAVSVCHALGKPMPPETIIMLAGPAGLYIAAKGKGR